jgi:hypothetical protein
MGAAACSGPGAAVPAQAPHSCHETKISGGHQIVTDRRVLHIAIPNWCNVREQYPPLVAIDIREVGTSGQRLAEVLALHKSNRAVLGFLPDEGFRDRARRGTLLAAIDNKSVIGYVLYDLPSDTIRIIRWTPRPVRNGHLDVAPR